MWPRRAGGLEPNMRVSLISSFLSYNGACPLKFPFAGDEKDSLSQKPGGKASSRSCNMVPLWLHPISLVVMPLAERNTRTSQNVEMRPKLNLVAQLHKPFHIRVLLFIGER